MSKFSKRKRISSYLSARRDLPADQKLCPRCLNIIPKEKTRCPACSYSPWIWKINLGFLLLTLVIALFLFLLIPLLTSSNGTRGGRPVSSFSR